MCQRAPKTGFEAPNDKMGKTMETIRWEDSGEGPFDTRADATEFAQAEVGLRWKVEKSERGWLVMVAVPIEPEGE